jgi:uncharacterized repeat protein (TIGR02543 family)
MILLAAAPETMGCGPPTVTTTAVTNITATTATSGGNVTISYSAVTARGVCWSTSGNPTTANSKTIDGTGLGVFTSNLTGLTPGTTYYLRAYATNSCTTSYGIQVSFTTAIAAPTVTTAAVANVTTTMASSGGNVTSGTSVTARGVCWNTAGSPTTANSKTVDGGGLGVFASSLTGLSPGTTYYVRAYATNAGGTSYGNQVSFTATLLAPTVTTAVVSNTTTTTATCGGTVTSGASVTARGVCWNTTGSPTTADNKTIDGSGLGAFVSSLAGLTPGMTYHVRAYATNTGGSAYGGEQVFETVALHTVTFVAGIHGTLTGTPIQPIAHGNDCTAVTAVSDVGHHFAGWTGDYVGDDNPLTITAVTQDLTVTADFAIDTHTVTFISDGHGSLVGITPQIVDYGGDCSVVSAVPDVGRHFTGWTGDYVGDDNPLTITAVTQDLMVTASFAIDTHTVTFVSDGHGSLSGTTPQIVDYGGDCSVVSAVPDAGYQFVSWTGTGAFMATFNPLIINSITSDLTIAANFAALPEDRGVPALEVAVRTITETGGADSSVVAGDFLSVEISVGNVGNAVASGVRVRLSLPENMELVSATVLGENDALSLPAGISVEGSMLTMEVGDLPAAGLFELALRLRAKSGGSARFAAMISSNEMPQGLEALPSDVTVQNEYIMLVQHPTLCGSPGILPFLVLAMALGLTRGSSRWRR